MKIAISVLFTLFVPAVFVYGADDLDRSEYEQILLPVNVTQTAGAHGSLWVSVLTVFNAGETAARYYPEGVSCPTLCVAHPADVSPGNTIMPATNVGSAERGAGAFFYIERDSAVDLGFSLRTQDLSRQSETFGTEIPVIREDELYEREIYLFTAPRRESFRQMLRIYSVNDGGAEFALRILNSRGETLHEDVIRTRKGGTEIREDFPSSPAYAQIANLESLLPADQLDGKGASIIIEPLTPGVRYWGFVSVTHDETQHVTVITPQ